MGLIKESLDIINRTVDGSIRRMSHELWESLFFKNGVNQLMERPIGIVAKNYDFMLDHIYRNIGNRDHFYDGYGTPIGEMANPFYNTIVSPPWFLLDDDKNMYSNYIEYVKGVYGATLSVKNINEDHDLRIIGEESKVASIPTYVVIDASESEFISLSPNNVDNDTRLGKVSAYYASETLYNSISENTRRNTIGITAILSDYYGLKTKPIENSLLTGSLNGLTDNLEAPFLDNPGIGNTNILYDDFINSLGTANKDAYLSNISENDYSSLNEYMAGDAGFETDVDEQKARYIFSTLKEHSTISDVFGGLKVYSEKGYDGNVPSLNASFNTGVRFGRISTFDNSLSADDLLKKTNDNFKNGKYKTIISRFHTKYEDGDETDITQTAISKIYGMSHGRNLLRKDHTGNDDNGYDNPYCRVWTNHHQYQSLENTIRPFMENGNIVSQSQLATQKGFNQFEAFHNLKGFANGRERLGEFGVLNKNNGLVNISPIYNSDENKRVDIKDCMFSIENLAWKDTLTGMSSYNIETLSAEQKGPFGGRIMWFPPYDLKFNEDVNVNWAETDFIGRGESIYTYKNTKRTGTISFKLLIDHPTIINYWTNALPSGNSSVDDVDSAEQELLRFFAGCDFLTPRVAPQPEKETSTIDEPVSSPNTETYTFFVFFPNNYSGVDDSPEKAIEYLINGYATWKTKDGDYYSPSNTAKAVLLPKNIEVGGYEMRPGISLNYPLTASVYGKYDEIGTVKYGNSKQVSFHVINEKGSDVKYYYRVDNKYASTPLSGGNSNYMDLAKDSASLNSKYGIDTVKQFASVEDDKIFSLADFYVAMQSDVTLETLGGLYSQINYNIIRNKIKFRKKHIESVLCTGSASKPGSDNSKLSLNRAKTIKNWLSSGEIKLCPANKISATTTTEAGGDSDVNSVSSKLYRHVRVDIRIKTEESETAQNLEKDGYTDFHNNEANAERKVVMGNEKKLDNITTFNDLRSNKYYEEHGTEFFNGNPRLNYTNNNNKLELNKRLTNIAGDKANNLPGVNNYVSPADRYALNGDIPNHDASNDNLTFMHTNERQYNNNTELESQGGFNTNSTGDESVGNKRYEGEARFFELLELNEPLLHHKISEKIKYFNPAFHSVSPEGFNARLTFLQQCCRQGPTNGASDSGAENTANNLAFGRPPVCILRIGDFFYTRIIIEGVTINYDNNGIQWDLNPEGIGVMPMMADVTIRFNFIGGSSLAGPISRLQNALSFNMYANTEVYDDRAELAEYDPNTGDITKLAPFNPSV